MNVVYRLQDAEGRSQAVHASRNRTAAVLDKDQNMVIEPREMFHFVEHEAHDCHHNQGEQKDPQALVEELQYHLTRQPHPHASAYHSYEQVSQKMDELTAANPGRCSKISIGTTPEGREIYALRLGDPSTADSRPGVVITGCHHAREWMSVEVPLHVADKLLNQDDPEMQRRLQSADIWIIPVANPDGLEFSRNEDTWWRKNRRPVCTDACGQATEAIGVDLNRNYDDGVHSLLYRPEGDTPESTEDDHGATSDSPEADTYRGPSGASEPEIKALLSLEMQHKNIRGVLDHHSYGEMILYPWGHTHQPAPNRELYLDIGKRLNEAMDNRYKLRQSSSLYPACGESDDIHNANGIISFTLEVGRSFQPKPSLIEPTCELVARANFKFIDEIVERAAQGTLPERT